MNTNQSFSGIVALLTGAFIFIAVVGNVLLRVLCVFMALGLINYGLRLMRKPSLFVLLQDFLSGR